MYVIYTWTYDTYVNSEATVVDEVVIHPQLFKYCISLLFDFNNVFSLRTESFCHISKFSSTPYDTRKNLTSQD